MLTVFGALSWKIADQPNRLLQMAIFGGDASYALYLTHPFIVNSLCKLAAHLLGNGPVVWPLTGVVVLLASLTVGVLFYVHIEQPLQRVLKTFLKRKQVLALNNA